MATVTLPASARLDVPPDEPAGRLVATADGPWWALSAMHPAGREAPAAAAARRLVTISYKAGRGGLRAEAVARGLDATLGERVEAVEGDAQRPELRGGICVAALAADVPIEPGPTAVTARVGMTYELATA
jgi:hypothetical protein